MEDILHHLVCLKPCPYQLVNRISCINRMLKLKLSQWPFPHRPVNATMNSWYSHTEAG